MNCVGVHGSRTQYGKNKWIQNGHYACVLMGSKIKSTAKNSIYVRGGVGVKERDMVNVRCVNLVGRIG